MKAKRLISKCKSLLKKHPKPDPKEVEIHSWNGPKDPEHPYTYKWVLTITVCILSVLVGIPAGAYGSGSQHLSHRFHVQTKPFNHAYWATTSWIVGAAFWPLVFVPMTQMSGRMPGYFISYILLIISFYPCAFGRNFATLIIVRFFGGGASSIVINLVGGSVTDVWVTPKERCLPMSIFGLASVIGISLGPFLGACIQAIRLSNQWRWIWYVQIIYNTGLLPIFYLILRETREDVVLMKQSAPTKMLVTEPVVTSFTLWISFAWGILFIFFNSVVQTYRNNYHMNTPQTGLIQLAITVGVLVGCAVNPFQNWLYLRTMKKNKEKPGSPIPECQLYTSFPGSLLFTGGLFWYGWSSFPHVHWIVPTFGIACTGVGIYSIYMAVVNYLADAYAKYSTSALSAASLGRNGFAAFMPLASQPMFKNIGYGWAGSFLGYKSQIIR